MPQSGQETEEGHLGDSTKTLSPASTDPRSLPLRYTDLRSKDGYVLSCSRAQETEEGRCGSQEVP